MIDAPPRRVPGKWFAIGLGLFLVVGTALTTYFAFRNEVARQHAAEQIRMDDAREPEPPHR